MAWWSSGIGGMLATSGCAFRRPHATLSQLQTQCIALRLKLVHHACRVNRVAGVAVCCASGLAWRTRLCCRSDSAWRFLVDRSSTFFKDFLMASTSGPPRDPKPSRELRSSWCRGRHLCCVNVHLGGLYALRFELLGCLWAWPRDHFLGLRWNSIPCDRPSINRRKHKHCKQNFQYTRKQCAVREKWLEQKWLNWPKSASA